MPKPSLKPLLFSISLGFLLAGMLGFKLTYDSTTHLYDKCLRLQELSLPFLPGPEYLATMQGLAPSWAGALFFALTLGIGFSSLAYAWVSIFRRTPWILQGILFSPLYFNAGWCFVRGEWLTSLCLAGISSGVIFIVLKLKGDEKISIKAIIPVCLIALGFIPWLTSDSNLAVNFRDRLLLGSNTFRTVSDLYYKWTLYPAEAIKTTKNLTQPVVQVGDEGFGEFCSEAANFRIICVKGGTSGFDYRLIKEGSTQYLEREGVRVEWPRGEGKWEAVAKLSDSTDHTKALRRATFVALFFGCPLGLLLLVNALVIGLFGKMPWPYVYFGAILAALAIGYASYPTEFTRQNEKLTLGTASTEEIAEAIHSDEPVRRMRGVLAAGKEPSKFMDELLSALEDPIINIRYNAALSLAKAQDERVNPALLGILNKNEDWYVKDRAYWALYSRGWRP